MVSKVIILAALVATALAAPLDGPTSFASFNENHNTVHHIQSAPALIKSAPVYAHAPAAAPVYAQAAAPAYAAPAYQAHYYASPAHSSASSYSTSSFAQHSAPLASYAAPIAKIAVPAIKVAPVAHYAAPVAKVLSPVAHYAPAAPAHHQEEYAHPKYEFAYAVEDHHTGDIHSQQEQRDGDHVVGQYSLHEADGTVRIVKYSDDGHGFNAVVERSGHPTEAPAVYKKLIVPVAKAVVAEPQYQHHY